MRHLSLRAARLYGDHLFHLIVVAAALALGAYTISVLGLRNLFNPRVWWQSIAVWFAVAVIGHDLILFPLYALIDRLLTPLRTAASHRGPSTRMLAHRSVTNYLRLPTLAAGLLLLLFLPGIIRQGAPAYHAATGLTQAPYLSRWLLLTAAFYLASALCYSAKTLAQRPRAATTDPPDTATINASKELTEHPA